MSKKFRLDRKIGFQNRFYTKGLNVIIDSIGPSIILRSIADIEQTPSSKNHCLATPYLDAVYTYLCKAKVTFQCIPYRYLFIRCTRGVQEIRRHLLLFPQFLTERRETCT